MIRLEREATSFAMVQYVFLTKECFHFHTENVKTYKKAVYEKKNSFKLSNFKVCVFLC